MRAFQEGNSLVFKRLQVKCHLVTSYPNMVFSYTWPSPQELVLQLPMGLPPNFLSPSVRIQICSRPWVPTTRSAHAVS